MGWHSFAPTRRLSAPYRAVMKGQKVHNRPAAHCTLKSYEPRMNTAFQHNARVHDFTRHGVRVRFRLQFAPLNIERAEKHISVLFGFRGYPQYSIPMSSIETKNPNAVRIKTKFGFLHSGGRWWIRTTEVIDDRFTVCSLWPLGKPPIWNFLCILSFIKERMWSWWTDLNPRPADYKSAALPTELHQRAVRKVQTDLSDGIYNITPPSQCQHFFAKIREIYLPRFSAPRLIFW